MKKNFYNYVLPMMVLLSLFVILIASVKQPKASNINPIQPQFLKVEQLMIMKEGDMMFVYKDGILIDSFYQTDLGIDVFIKERLPEHLDFEFEIPDVDAYPKYPKSHIE